MTNTVSKELAKRLAVVYGAFDAACDKKDNLGIAVWGEALLSVQEAAGIEMHNPDNVAAMVRHARNAMYGKVAA